MFRGRFLGFLFIMLLVVGLLGLAGSSIYRAGWTQGYFIGKVSDGAAAGETVVVSPDPAPSQPAHYGRGFSPVDSFFGTVVKCILALFLIGMFFKFIGFLMWRGRGGWHREWHKHGRHGRWRNRGHWGKHFDGTPPWYDDDADEPMKA
jgi:hypothetical protein